MLEKVTATAIKIALAEKHWKDFFLTEVKSGPTQLAMPGGLKILDGLAVRKSWTNPCFTGYEVKISRSDFLRDAKFYTYEELCNCLYIVCPKGMIERTELPESVGLMYYDPEKKTITTRKKAIFRKIEYSPENLVSLCPGCHNAMHDRESGALTAKGMAWMRRVSPPPPAKA